jgi:DNA-directed RNA polymerase specialized sigma24 family protein
MTKRRHRQLAAVFAPKRLHADNRYGVDQLDNVRLEVLPRYHREASADDPWLAPAKSEAVRALLIHIGAAQNSGTATNYPVEFDLELLCQDAGLTDCQTEVVLMCGEGFGVVAIARMLEISHQAVSLRLHNGRRKILRQIPPLDALRAIQAAQ